MAKKKKKSPQVTEAKKRRATAHKKQNQFPWLWFGLFVVIGLALGAFLFARLNTLEGEISVAEAHAMVEDGAFLLDVREQHEWDEFHIPGATLIPLGELPGRVNELPRDKDIVVVCRTGNRSQEGRSILLSAGFERVTSMAGGVVDWRSAGYPIDTGP